MIDTDTHLAEAKRHEETRRSHELACELAIARMDAELARLGRNLLTGGRLYR